jgi:gliding motility-associated lipoprotein GldH
MRITAIALLLTFILAGCSKPYAWQEKQDIAESGWLKTDLKSFSYEAKDSTSIYNLYLTLEHSNEYAWDNIYLKVNTVFPDKNKQEQVLNFTLADKTGKWVGEKSGGAYHAEFVLQEGFYFNQAGSYKFEIEPYMRMDTLLNISSVGLKLEQSKEKRGADTPK